MGLTKNDPIFHEYVSGQRFNSDCHIEFTFDLKVKNRDDILKDLVKNKRIIHVGCVDHLDIIESKISAGTWLHKLLLASASRCLGVDTNKEGIRYLEDNHHITDLVCADLSRDQIPEIENEKWDYILLPEVIEHIPDAVNFLSAIHEKYSNNIGKIIISVPNLFAYTLFKSASRNVEIINTDHRYWFSPYTLTKILNDAGIKVEQMYLINGFWGPLYCNLRERITNRVVSLLGFKRNYKKVTDMRYAKGLLVIAR